ncbi:hypothetical protein [Nocardia sp. NBC_00403]|uniref:hypothetical protein n=1 Tax=Nocardia sp. NBC_00403 TaxID=2975990 RepID=UPI002E24E22E
MSDLTPEDEMTREITRLGRSAAAVVAAWQARNPGKTKVPRRVRKDAMKQLREAMRAHELLLANQRIQQRAGVEEVIGRHRSHSLRMHETLPATPEEFSRWQWNHAHQRRAIAEVINVQQHLTREERGQAVMALVSAHYADNPNVPQRPVWGPAPTGISALKARLAERVSRAREGLEQRRDIRSARKAPQWPAGPSAAGLHQYWSAPMPQQDQAANARIAQMQRQDLAEETWWQERWAEAGAVQDPMLDQAAKAQFARLEQQLRELADFRERERALIIERDELQAKVTEFEGPEATKPVWHDPEIDRQAAQLDLTIDERALLIEESPPWEFDSPQQCGVWVRDIVIAHRGYKINTLEQDVVHAYETVTEIRDERDSVAATLDYLRDDRSDRRVELDGLRSDVDEICKELASVTGELNRVTEERDALLLERDRGWERTDIADTRFAATEEPPDFADTPGYADAVAGPPSVNGSAPEMEWEGFDR